MVLQLTMHSPCVELHNLNYFKQYKSDAILLLFNLAILIDLQLIYLLIMHACIKPAHAF